jgi:hypothetical protein
MLTYKSIESTLHCVCYEFLNEYLMCTTTVKRRMYLQYYKFSTLM